MRSTNEKSTNAMGEHAIQTRSPPTPKAHTHSQSPARAPFQKRRKKILMRPAKRLDMRLVFEIAAGQTMRRAVGVKALPKIFAA